MRVRTKSVSLRTTRFDPAQAEVTVTVVPEEPVPDLGIRGRLMGPRCLYAETVEVAYPLRTIAGPDNLLRARVIIPEASLWEPRTPFLYQGPIELWHAGQRVDRVHVTHGLRQLTLGPAGLRLNGQAVTLRATVRRHLTDEEAATIRQAGYDCLLTDTLLPESLLEMADRVGFLVFRRVPADHGLPAEAIRACVAHPCFAGWIVRGGVGRATESAISTLRHDSPTLIGVDLDDPPELPEGLDFVVCGADQLPAIRDIPIPKLVRGEAKGEQIIGMIER